MTTAEKIKQISSLVVNNIIDDFTTREDVYIPQKVVDKIYSIVPEEQLNSFIWGNKGAFEIFGINIYRPTSKAFIKYNGFNIMYFIDGSGGGINYL